MKRENSSSNEILERKFKLQTELLEKILDQTEKNQKTLLWIRALGIIRILIIVIPIILGIIYLPPFINKLIDKYKDFSPGIEKIREMLDSYKTDLER